MAPYSLIKAASFTPNSMQSPNAWIGHLPFAAWVIREISPKIFVELGTHSGNSYFSFCQSVVEAGISSKCYAVDTWRGDEFTGLYGDEIFAKVNAHHQEHYAEFSRLLRMTFDDAVTYFADESINLLHIDGLHTYEAVRHDFETWLPKLAPGAVVLFHDTNVRERHFGVWKFWEELQERYPNNLEFVHSNGLGVLQLNNAPDNRKLEWLLYNSPEKQRLVVYFAALGSRQLDRYELNEQKQQIDNLNQAVAERDGQIADLKNKMDKFDGDNTSLNSLLKWLKAQLQLVKRFINGAIHPFEAYRLSRDVQTIKNSSLFEVDYYLSSYPDVRVSACSPLQHYCEFGWKEGRNPSPLFNTNNYLMNNPDVAALGTNPLVHYINFGKFEGRDPLLVDNIDASPDPCRRAELMLQANDGIRRIFVIDWAVPTPDRDSGSVRMFGLLRIMRGMGFSVTFAADKLENGANYISALNSLEINVLQGYTEIRRHLQKWGNGYAVVIISRPEMGERYLSVVRAYAAQAQLDYDTVDLYHLRFKRGAELTGNPDLVKKAQEYHQLEMLCCTTADRVFAITDTEKKVIQQNWPNTQVEVIPNVHPVKVSPSPWSAREGLVFIGGYDHHPNVDAVVWFVQEIFPIITKSIPGIKFTILGSNPPEAVRTLATSNVMVEGWVPDPEPYFSASRVFVAPLRYGAGMKGKVGQAMSLGLPVVTTQIGAEGMQLKDNVHALIADTPEAFAAAVVRLYANEEMWERMQQDAATHIDKYFSESAVESILRNIWADSGQKQRSIPPLQITEVLSYEEYNSYIDTHRDTNLAIQSSENSLLPSTPTEFTVNGYCYICKTNVDFLVDFNYSYEVDGVVTPNWRERLVCPSCLLNNRMRAIAHIFEDTLYPNRNAKIFITEQTTALYKLIKQSFPKTIGSEYLGDVVSRGKCDDNGIRNEDLTHLSFDNDAFDYIMSFDVFEHIPDYKRALAECYRCLKPGGTLYFSVPFVKTSEKNIVRARLSGTGEVIHLLDPEYHGDPLSSNGCLCFYHFGWEILDDLRDLGFEDAKALIFWSLELGYLGGHQIIFAATKSQLPTTLH